MKKRKGQRSPATAAPPAPEPASPAPAPASASASAKARWLRRHAALLAVGAAYLVVFPYFERLNNPNENVRVWTTRAIVAHGTFKIDPVEREWGEVSDRAAYHGSHYAAKAPGASLLGVPVLLVQTGLYKIAGAGPPSRRATVWALRVFAMAVPVLLFLWFFGTRVERETGSAGARDLLVVALGLGTMFYPYGLTFSGHVLAAAALFAGFLFLREDGSARRLAVGGALAGTAVVFEYQALFAVLVVAVFAVARHRRRVWPFFAGAAGPALLLAAFHTALFGRPWETPLAHVDDPVYRVFHGVGFLGLGVPKAKVLWQALVTADYGLFVFSPWLAAGLIGATAAASARRGQRAEGLVVVAVFVVMLLFLAGMSNWRGGWCAGGPRYVATVVPFLAWGVALSWRRWWAPRPWAMALLAGLVLAGVALCVLAGGHFPHYPLQFDNPVYDLTIPLLGAGWAPYGLGWALGLRGLASYLPLAAAVLAALVLAGRALRPRPPVLIGAVVIAAAMLGALSFYGRRPHPDERHALGVVRAVWEPPSGRGDGVP